MTSVTQPELELSWEDVECFVRPQLVLAKALGNGLDRELLLLIALHKANGLGGYFGATENSYFKFVDEVASPLLGLDFQWQDFDSAEEALTTLKAQTPAAAPVLVPGNIRELYYYEGYKEKDWAHYFIVDEYLDSRELFRVRDNLQLSLDSRSTEYRPFVIPGSQLFGTMRLFAQSHVEGGYLHEDTYYRFPRYWLLRLLPSQQLLQAGSGADERERATRLVRYFVRFVSESLSDKAQRSDQDLDQLDRALSGGGARATRFLLMATNQRALYVRLVLHALALLAPERHALVAPRVRKVMGEKNSLQTMALVKLHRSGPPDVKDRQQLLAKLSGLIADVDRCLLQEAGQAVG